MNSYPFRGAAGALALACLSLPASAHAVLERPEATEGATYRGVVQITHGCKASPTISVSVTIPEGAIGARPLVKPGWTITTKRGPYARPYPYFHEPLSEGIQEITWTSGSVPSDQFDEFVFSVRMSDAFKAGDSVPFPVVQRCENGSTRWVQVPAPGQDSRQLGEPAPSVRIVPAASRSSASASATKVGALTIEQPWMRAVPAGAKVAGGYLRVTNAGTEPDRLVAASLPIARRGEVHEMSNEGGIMRMREVEGGIEIRPGQTIELKPGGFHLMFVDLTAAPKEGEPLGGSLVFQKAGRVDVTFAVTGVGARAPSEHHHP